MAKTDTVYSMFGMKTPQQVAQEELTRRIEYLQSQRTPYQQAGAGLATLAMSLFGGDSAAMERAKMGEAVVQSARMDYAREQRMREAEAKAAQQEALDARLSGLEGAIASEAGTGMLPDVQPKAPTDAELMMQRLTKAAGLYDTIADRLDAAGFSVEAENARARARESIGGLLTVRKQVADIGLAEAKTKKELAPTDYKNVGRYVRPDGTPFQGGRRGNIIYDLNTGLAVPDAIAERKEPEVKPQKFGTTVTSAFADAFLKQNALGSELGVNERKTLADWVANRATALINDPDLGLDGNQATLRAIQEAISEGVLVPEPGVDLGFLGTWGGGASINIAGQQPAPQSAPQQSDQGGTNLERRKTANGGVAIYDTSKNPPQFVQWAVEPKQ